VIVSTTNRLTLSKITVQDAPFFVKLMNTPGFIKYIGDRNIRSVDDAASYLENDIIKSYQDNGFSYYKVVLKEDLGNILGIVGILKREQLECPDIGFAFLPQNEGKGYAFEATSELMRLAKDKFNIAKVSAITLELNKSSIKLLEKLGLTFEKRIKPFDNDDELLLFAKEL
jgi:RimJ/RimL family protein N-acetyltransferase